VADSQTHFSNCSIRANELNELSSHGKIYRETATRNRPLQLRGEEPAKAIWAAALAGGFITPGDNRPRMA